MRHAKAFRLETGVSEASTRVPIFFWVPPSEASKRERERERESQRERER